MPEPTTTTGNPTGFSIQTLLNALANLKQGGQQGGSGKVSPLVSQGMVGQPPQAPTVPQVAGAGSSMGMQMPGRMAGAIGQPTPNQPGPQAPIQNGLMQTGFEFNSPSGRDAAVTTSAIQGVTQFLTQAKEKKEAKTKTQAENYMSQITAAQQSGDQETLNLLLQDPKVVSTLEKGLDYFMPKVPGEPAPPEAKGIHSFLNKLTGKGKQQQPQRLPALNTPGGVAIPRAPQSDTNAQAMKDILSKAALAAVQGDPALARQLGLGTSLTGEEARKAEQYQAGLALAPADERRAFLANQSMLEKFDQENKQLLTELASREKIASQGLSSAERQAQISAGPMYYRAKIAKDIADSQIKIKQMVANGKVGEANRYAMTTITTQIGNLRNNASKVEKDNPDMAKDFIKQADDLQKRYDELQKSNEFNVDQLIQDILQP